MKNIIFLLIQKYYFPIDSNMNKINTENLKKNLIGNDDTNNLIPKNNNNYPIVLSHKRKRSSSFNSILSNISKGSNIYFNNNNKLLEGEKEKKDEDKKEENNTSKRKGSISSWNDENKNIFDLDINQDENKSLDLLNNSQTSFNDIIGHSENTISDINN